MHTNVSSLSNCLIPSVPTNLTMNLLFLNSIVRVLFFAPQNQNSKRVTFGQFIFLDTYFANYQESRDKTDLNKFIAAAYLPFGQRFTEPVIDANYEWVAKTDILSREAIVINYYLIRDWLCEVYPLVFQRKTEQQIKEDETKINKISRKKKRSKQLD